MTRQDEGSGLCASVRAVAWKEIERLDEETGLDFLPLWEGMETIEEIVAIELGVSGPEVERVIRRAARDYLRASSEWNGDMI